MIFKRKCVTAMTIVSLFFASCGDSGSDTTQKTGENDTVVADTTQAVVAGAKTEYFYHELQPTAKATYYFSQSVKITYTDATDLARQQTDGQEKLKKAAAKDGADLGIYNQLSSRGTATQKECDDEKKNQIRDLENAKETVKQLSI